MAMTSFCDNQGCRKENNPLLDLATNTIICGICGKEIKSISPIMKSALKNCGQVKKKSTPKDDALVFPCKVCKMQCEPKLIKGNACCVRCNNKFENFPLPFLQMLKTK